MTQVPQREFLDLVKAIGESKSKQEEDRIVAEEVHFLKKKIPEQVLYLRFSFLEGDMCMLFCVLCEHWRTCTTKQRAMNEIIALGSMIKLE